MANTSLKFGNGNWAIKENSALAYSDQYDNFKPLPFDFSRASSGTIVNKEGLIETVGNGIPRIDFADSEDGALKLEPQSTNLVTYSSDFSQWNSNNATIEGGYLAPDGTNNAYKVSGDSTSSLTFSLGLNSTDTRTIWARTISGSGQVNLTSNNNNTNNLFTITEQWQRFEVNGTTSSSGQAFFYAVDFRGSSTLTEVVLWGAQAENLSYATSYIPTQGSTSTRVAETCNNSGSAQDFNSTEGVLYFECKTDNINVGSISINDGTLSNRITARFRTDINKIQLSVLGSTDDFNINSELITLSNYNKIAIVYNNGDYYFFVNGVKSSVVSKGTFLANTFIQLDFNRGGGSEKFFGKTKNIQVFTEALSDEELQKLTTI